MLAASAEGSTNPGGLSRQRAAENLLEGRRGCYARDLRPRISSMARRVAQLPLPIGRQPQADRNLHKGGRSFYFFDFDDNVMTLGTQIYVFHRRTREELALSTEAFAQLSPLLGEEGPYLEYEIDLDDQHGSFRRFRDLPAPTGEQPFVEDVREAIAAGPVEWHGPSWDLFHHAVYNQRPIAIITARGHAPDTVARGVEQLVEAGHLDLRPNYLSILPVSHPETRRRLGDPDGSATIPELKMAAILRCVEEAMDRYGHSPYHRFGMSDDSPENLELITAAMRKLKERYPDNAFFVIDASDGRLIKTEVSLDRSDQSVEVEDVAQLDLF